MDDLSRVKRAADAATGFGDFRNKLRDEERRKGNEVGPDSLRPYSAVVLHTDRCATHRDRTKTQGSVNPCDCGANRKYRQGRADMIEAHLDCAGTMSHRNALELRDHWYAAEAELTDALETNEKFSRGDAHPAPDSFPLFTHKVPIHGKGCKFLDSSYDLTRPCTCGIHHSSREKRHTQIKSHLDEGRIISPPDGYELWTLWEQTERELTDALEQLEKLSARINSDGAVMDDLERER